MSQVYNFSAGPAMLPAEVLQQAQGELCDWQGMATSVMEVSHRSDAFISTAKQAEQDLRDLMAIPDNYKVLFLQGGARGQFSALPMNLLGNKTKADYINSGFWSQCAANEAQKYGAIYSQDIRHHLEGEIALLPQKQWQLHDDTAYVHYCHNETIDGLALHQQADFADKIVVTDMSSSILSCHIDVSRYGVIYASAQKNIGPSGLTLVIVREDLLGRAHPQLPSVFNYTLQADRDSMLNTPPTFAWYLAGLSFKWLKKQGGVKEIALRNTNKAALLYQQIDRSDFYVNQVAKENRSLMNVPFRLHHSQLDALFLSKAEQAGLLYLKGHSAVGGIRASIYNAMPIDGVIALTDFMKEFERTQG